MATRQRVIRKVGTFGRHIRNGFVRTTTGGGWLYMLLPSQPPVRDAATWEQREQAARPILTILQALAERTPHLTLAGRKANKALYRQIHILAVSASIPFEPSRTLDPDTRVRLDEYHRITGDPINGDNVDDEARNLLAECLIDAANKGIRPDCDNPMSAGDGLVEIWEEPDVEELEREGK